MLCADFVYVIVFPQLVLVLYFERYTNTYGSIVGFVVALVLRLLCKKKNKKGASWRSLICVCSRR